LQSLDQLSGIARVEEPREDSLLFDLLWNDPLPEIEAISIDFAPNVSRGGKKCHKFGSGPLS